MTHYNTHYDTATKSPEELDKKALEDIKDYLGRHEKGYEMLLTLIDYAIQCRTAEDVQGLNFSLGMVGISGRPFHAFCRKYCLPAFLLWLSSDTAGGSVVHDEKGFW